MDTQIKLLLPGWSFDQSAWQPFTNNISNAMHINWKGAETAGDIADSAKKGLKVALAKNAGRPVPLIGWSMGALAALELAASYPESVACLILFAPTSCFVKRKGYEAGWDRRIVKRMQKRLHEQPQETIAVFRQNMFSPAEHKSGAAERAMRQWQLPKSENISPLSAGLDYLCQTDLREQLCSIQHPSLLIHGLEDQICPAGAAEAIASRLSGLVQMIGLPDTGHAPLWTNADTCFRLVDRFLKGVLVHD